MAKRSIDLPSYQDIEKLYDEGNIEKLREYNERLAKTANQRMKQLWQSGVKSSEALARAKYYIYQESEVKTGGVFSRSKKLTGQQLVDNIREELIFLRSQSSTVRGEKQLRAEKSFETLTKGRTTAEGKVIKLEIPTDIKVPRSWEGSKEEYFREKFFKFLEQDVWKDIKKFLYTSEDVSLLKEAGEAIARGASIKDLNAAYKSYLQNEVDIYTMWDNWTSIK